MQIVPLGDSVLIVRLREQFENAVDETLDHLLGALEQLRSAAIPGVIELAPAYTSIAIFYDPIAIAKLSGSSNDLFDRLATQVRFAVRRQTGHRSSSGRSQSRTIEIPVCYHPEFAPDIDRVAEHAKLSPREVVALHSAPEYRVACVGFVPGFPFLAGLPKKLATPRRPAPRKDIPPGSVGIGGAQTGIYPLRSPGGWNLIGRTPFKLFDPAKNPPTLLRSGDRVRFRAITRDEFESFKQ